MKNTRNRVRLTESQLHQVIKESVKKVLNEEDEYGMFNTLSSMRHPEVGEAGKFAKTGNDELKHYYNDDYEYIKGKGWQLKDNMDESIRRAKKYVVRNANGECVVSVSSGILMLSKEYADIYTATNANKIIKLFAERGIDLEKYEYIGKL